MEIISTAHARRQDNVSNTFFAVRPGYIDSPVSICFDILQSGSRALASMRGVVVEAASRPGTFALTRAWTAPLHESDPDPGETERPHEGIEPSSRRRFDQTARKGLVECAAGTKAHFSFRSRRRNT